MNNTRRQWMKWAAAGVVSTLAGSLTGCGGGSDASPAEPDNGLSTLQAQVYALPLEALSDAERAGLLFMREEEQLAHDVYIASAARWPALPVFGNIAESETRHAAAVAYLLERYAIADPMEGIADGVFPTPDFQTLHDQLVARSAGSLIDALVVGCEIEELDMRDIATQLLAADNADIRTVYEHLLRGSRNHLRSFYAVLLQQGGSYTPQYIAQAEFDAIVNATMESGT